MRSATGWEPHSLTPLTCPEGARDGEGWGEVPQPMMTEPIEKFHPHRGDWLRDIVFGLNDGLVTTLVFVIAVSALTRTQFVTVALSELLAGGVSMGLGGYLAARAAQEVLANRIATERQEIAEEPDEERAELRAIYYEKGLRGTLLERVVSDLTAGRGALVARDGARRIGRRG